MSELFVRAPRKFITKSETFLRVREGAINNYSGMTSVNQDNSRQTKMYSDPKQICIYCIVEFIVLINCFLLGNCAQEF